LTEWKAPDLQPDIAPRIASILRLVLGQRWAASRETLTRALAPLTDREWAAVVHAARIGNVSPLMYWVLRDIEIVPASILESLRTAYYYTARRNIVLFHELGAVLRRFADAGIDVLILKGAALASTIYHNPALRPMDDVDLMVRREETYRAVQALGSMGYEPDLVERCAGYAVAYEDQASFVRLSAERPKVELHWFLFNPVQYQPVVPVGWFWESARLCEIDGLLARTLGCEAEVLYLCAHIWQHAGARRLRLLWLHDIAEVVARRAPDLDRGLLRARAWRYGLLHVLEPVLGCVREEWRCPVPEDELARLRQELDRAKRAPEAYVPLRKHWLSLASIAGWRARARFVACNLVPSASYMARHYGVLRKELLPLCYAYRWARGAWLAASHAFSGCATYGPNS